MFLEPTGCVCGETDRETLFSARDLNFRSTDQVAEIARCKACRSVFPTLFPAPGSEGESYSNYYTLAPRKRFRAKLIDWTRSAYMLRGAPKSGSVLDYGCGSGAYLGNLAASHPRTDRFGYDVVRSNVPGRFAWISSLDGRAFDHITLSHVLEHVPDPAALLRQLAGSLNHHGKLWVAVPNADSILIEAFGEHARDVDFPRHRVLLTRDGLTELARRAGLVPQWHRSPIINTLMNIAHCARNLVRDGALSRGERVRRLIRGLLRLMTLDANRAPELVGTFKAA